MIPDPENLPGYLRDLANEVEAYQKYQHELRDAVLDFERGVKSLPELLKIAKETL